MTAYDSAPRRETNTGLLIASILATLFCCSIAGIIAIVFAAQGKDERARTWLIVSVVLGVIQAAVVGVVWFGD